MWELEVREEGWYCNELKCTKKPLKIQRGKNILNNQTQKFLLIALQFLTCRFLPYGSMYNL